MSYAFASSGIASLSVDKLVQIGDDTTISDLNYGQFSWAFQYVTTLLQLSFPFLEKIYASGNDVNGGTFANNQNITRYDFPKLTTIAKAPNYTYGSSAQNNIFYRNTALSELHFAAANQAAIEATSGYATKWGAPAACTIYFDL